MLCPVRTRKGHRCPNVATFMGADGIARCHVHADRRFSTKIRKRPPYVDPAPVEPNACEATHRALFFQRATRAIGDALGWKYVPALRFAQRHADAIRERCNVMDAASVRDAAMAVARETTV